MTRDRTTMIEYCTFSLDGHLFGVEAERVQELLRPQALTPVPTAAPVVAGLMSLRGQIVTALDLRQRLGLAPLEGQRPMTVVVRREAGTVALLVDAIGAVVDVDPADLEAPPETVAGPGRELILGVHQLPERLLLILDVDAATRPGAEVAA
ncbi:chemotaxis protein CheW [Euzebya sp.]|uniref:chemotaxis protein CheW n=1 Tax=Euzebya sp. TaxID=1971409 RepID=UPI0035175CA2